MDVFFKLVNKKVHPGQCPTPDGRLPDAHIAILKIFEKPIQLLL